MRFRSLRLGLAVSTLLLLGLGCASTPRPGTGDVAFRLYWQGEEDLDLHVQEPSGDTIYFQHRKSDSGGELDIDCNSAADRICRKPVENVYWPVGKAADGDYTYWVELFQHGASPPPVPFVLQVLEGTRIVHTETGSMTGASGSSPRFRFTYRRGSAPGRGNAIH